ncbi:MAG: tetratricopeptide repeat protein [Gemmatimonadota bacterium]
MTDRGLAPRLLVLVSFVTLTLGFLAGYWLRGSGEGGGPVAEAPHDVGVEEFVRLGMHAFAAGDYTEAERRFRAAVDLDPEDPNPRVDLAVALMTQGRWEDADHELGEAKQIAPSMPAIWFLEGWVARDGLGDSARARTAWQRFLELAPPDAPQVAEVQRWLEGLAGEEPGGEGVDGEAEAGPRDGATDGG